MALDGVLFKAAVCVPMFVLLELGASISTIACVTAMAANETAMDSKENGQVGAKPEGGSP